MASDKDRERKIRQIMDELDEIATDPQASTFIRTKALFIKQLVRKLSQSKPDGGTNTV